MANTIIPIKRLGQQDLEEMAIQRLEEFIHLLKEIENDEDLENWKSNGQITLDNTLCAFACSIMALNIETGHVDFIIEALKNKESWIPKKGATWKRILQNGEEIFPNLKGFEITLRTKKEDLLKRFPEFNEKEITKELNRRKEKEMEFIQMMINNNTPLIASIPRHLDVLKHRSHQVVIHGIMEDENKTTWIIITDPDNHANYQHHTNDIKKDGDTVYIRQNYWQELSHGMYLLWVDKNRANILDDFLEFAKSSDELFVKR